MPDAKTTNLNTIRAAFMRRASAPDINALALKLAYLIAYKYLNSETGTAHPSQDTLARDLNVTTRTVRTLLDILQPLGLVVLPGHGPNRASTYWIDPDGATPMSPIGTEKRKPASGYKRKPASGSEPNTGNLAHDNRKLDAQIPEASFHPTKKKNQEEEPIVAGAATPATGERESERSLADHGALADGGAREEFEELASLWHDGRGWPYTDRHEAEARRQYVIARRNASHDEIMAAAHAWVAAIQPDERPKLADWLSRDNWRKPPPKRRQTRGTGKVSLAQKMYEQE